MARQSVKGTDRPRAQWYWNSSYDPWLRSGKEEWTKYSDIESEIIEEAFNGKSKTELAELDNYWLNLKDSVQISKLDQNKQRPIKRVLIKRNENEGLREQRFFLPQPLKPFSHGRAIAAYTFLSQWKRGKQFSDAEIVEQAALGIILEGKQLDQHRESQWIAAKLTAVSEYSVGYLYYYYAGLGYLYYYAAGDGYGDAAAGGYGLYYAGLGYLYYAAAGDGYGLDLLALAAGAFAG
ncbi:unnamed protein product [Didymodactylos carnosus]|uniref:WWE domain-containing protein n=1 Tax=Didymodactylos carnosus TaxID=1234261 RepID=A0A8S2CVU4_9BILA|nr:unnamed protein product [Didymodactylos carnosus]CAF3527662.1 unnamed protein product [Didymodactylos carnosus]